MRLPTVHAHEIRLVQLLQNLIGNAIKYRRRSRRDIHVSAERREEDWLFSVQDNGIGIKPEYAQQVFGIFKRLHGQDYREPVSAWRFASGLWKDTAAGSGWSRSRGQVPCFASRFRRRISRPSKFTASESRLSPGGPRKKQRKHRRSRERLSVPIPLPGPPIR